MGTRKKFSAAEQELLRTNPYTEKVTEHQISFTLAFKQEFWRLSVEGCTGNMALRKLGYDPELLGFERVHNITKRIRRAGKHFVSSHRFLQMCAAAYKIAPTGKSSCAEKSGAF